MLREIPCTIMRGGTSKALFFRLEDLPPAGPERDRLLLAVMGSPDVRQIDGLGGSVSTTSKVAVISRSARDDADIDYTFIQLAVDRPIVDYKANCGNISSAVGPYAIHTGLVKAAPGKGITVVRVFNTNTSKVIFAHVPTEDGRVQWEGDYAISGVPGSAAQIKLAFKRPGGSVTKKLLPTGNASDILDVEGIGRVRVSIVDASNPLVFVRAEDLGLTGRESPEELDAAPGALACCEAVRGAAAVKLGFTDDWRKASSESAAVPKLTLVAPPADCAVAGGGSFAASEVDIIGRMMAMQKTHRTYALTGALCTASAAAIKGTVVAETARPGFDPAGLRIGHPGGIMQNGVETDTAPDGSVDIAWAFGFRTARLLMSGTAYYVERKE